MLLAYRLASLSALVARVTRLVFDEAVGGAARHFGSADRKIGLGGSVPPPARTVHRTERALIGARGWP
jgi:hypothetical protein